MDYLDQLEAEAIYILREVAGQFDRPALLFSGGKDSICLVHLAIKAFRPGKFPFPLVHVDTGHNFEETLTFRDELAAKLGEQLIVRKVEDTIKARNLQDGRGKFPSRNGLQTYTLLDVIEEFEFDACIVELVVTRKKNVRVFPISNWTELDVWNYIKREKIELPSIYFTHERECILTENGQLMNTNEFVTLEPSDVIVNRNVRYRTVGDMTCTAAVESEAYTVDDIIAEIKETKISERGATRMDDRVSEAAMEDRKKGGYF